jgi:HEAT repeat protein
MLRIRKFPGRWIRIAGIGMVLAGLQNFLMGNPQQGTLPGTLSDALNRKSGPGFEDMIKALQGKDSYERDRAIMALGRSGNPDALEPLLKALKDDDYFARSFAAIALGSLKDLRAVDPLIQALEDKNERVRRSAAEALGTLGDLRALDPLIKALKSEDVFMQRSVAIALGALGDPRAAEPLLQVLRSTDNYVWNGASEALIQIGSRCIPKLVEQLGDWMLGPRVAEILQDLNWKPASDLEKVRLDVALRNKQALTQNWEISHKVLAEDLRNGSERQIENAVYAFIAIGREESIEDLKVFLKDKGTLEMAKAFIGCGNALLAEFARNWAKEKGMDIQSAQNANAVTWGSM